MFEITVDLKSSAYLKSHELINIKKDFVQKDESKWLRQLPPSLNIQTLII